MKAEVLNLEGGKLKEIELPKCFSAEIRKDIISRVLEIRKTMQPYGPFLMAGKQYSASGKMVHRRHVWRSGYGRGQSRVPRKIFSQRGSNFNWEAAEVSSTRGGRRAHPPKPIAHKNTLKINKKELILALNSSISATANKKEVSNKYEKINEKSLRALPLIVESKIVNLKTKKLLETFKKILGKTLFETVMRKRTIRAGKGKLRGRKYKKNAGVLLVTGKNEKIKTNLLDVKNVKNLNVTDLAKGGVGRLVIYTEQSIKDLDEKFSKNKEKKK